MAQERNGSIAAIVGDYIGWCSNYLLEESAKLHRLGVASLYPITQNYVAAGASFFQAGLETTKSFYKLLSAYDIRPLEVPFRDEIKAEEINPQQYTPLEGIPQAEVAANIQTTC